jgi:MYXO-CTERM domain-containing protein
MRFCSVILLTLAWTGMSVRGEYTPVDPALPAAAGATSSILLARMGGIAPFSTGSASPQQRNLSAESQSVQTESNMIYYATFSLTPIMPTHDNGLGDTGDTGAVTGGGGNGSAIGGEEPLVSVPSPGAAALALIGLGALPRRQRVPVH